MTENKTTELKKRVKDFTINGAINLSCGAAFAIIAIADPFVRAVIAIDEWVDDIRERRNEAAAKKVIAAGKLNGALTKVRS